MKIGVVLESFKKDIKESIRIAKSLGLCGVQIHGGAGELNVDDLTTKQIQEMRQIITGEGLEISALCGDLGCSLFYESLKYPNLVEKEKKIMHLAKELGTDVVTTHVGVIPSDENCDLYKRLQDICKEFAEFADKLQGHFAIETGPESSIVLKNFLDKLGSKGVAVNLDVANLVMCIGEDPVEAVYNLRDYIVHTHAKDGVMLCKVDTRRIYDSNHNGVEPIVYDDYFKEKPLGHGKVDFDAYLAALHDIGYDKYLTIEREVGENPIEDIRLAKHFLDEKLKGIR